MRVLGLNKHSKVAYLTAQTSTNLNQKKHMTNTDIVKQALDNFATGNAACALALFDPAIEWHECNGTNKATGHAFKANATHGWIVKNEKLSHFFQAVDTVAIIS